MAQQSLSTAGKKAEQCERLRLELTQAMFHKDIPLIKSKLMQVAELGFELELESEVLSAALLLDRLELEIQQSFKVEPLDKKGATSVKSMLNPPVMVKDLLHAAVILLGANEENAGNWDEAVKCLRGNFLNMVDNLDIRNMPVEVAQRAKNVIKDFDIDQMKKVSCDAAAIYEWCTAVITVVLTNADRR